MIKNLLIAAFVFASVASASAIQITEDVLFGAGGQLVNSSQSASGTFDFTPDIPNLYVATAGLFEVTYGTFDGQVGGTAAMTLSSQDFTQLLSTGNFTAFATLGLDANVFLDLNTDGKISFTIQPAGATDAFTVFGAKLTVAAESKNVPDGGSTVALLGLGLVGVESLRRRFAVVSA